jgi:RHS repeat-associated protein
MTNPTVTTQYDFNSNVVAMTDARTVTTATTYDQLNRARVVTQAVGLAEAVQTESQYDGNGNVIAVILHNSAGSGGDQRTAYTYDGANRKLTESLPVPSDLVARVTTYTYTPTGAVQTVIDPKGQIREMEYDLANRLVTSRNRRADNSLEETRTYSYVRPDQVQALHLQSVNDLTGSTAYAYDGLYRVVTETRSTNGQATYVVASGYDAVGNRTQVTYPGTSRQVTSTYDRARRLSVVADSTSTSTSTQYSYDANGNRFKTIDSTGPVTMASFDALNRCLGSTKTMGSTTIAQYTFAFDLVGNRRTVAESLMPAQSTVLVTRNITYNYDGQYRLLSEAWGAISNTYTYDLAGNRIKLVAVNGATATTTNTFDVLNRLLTSTGGQTATYTYDLNGNQIAQGGTATASMTWDTNNRLVSVTVNGATSTYAYDYRSRRQLKTVAGTTTFFRYDQGVSFQESVAGALQVEFVRGTDMGGGIGSILYSDRTMVSGGIQEVFAYNPAVGHVVGLTNAAGATAETNQYDAFGNIVGTSGTSKNNRLANTKERDVNVAGVLTLDDHGMRYYNPVTGRYISRDPLGYPDGLNNYLHVHNNPINRIDSLGLEDTWSQRWAKSISAAAQAAKDAVNSVASNVPGGWVAAGLVNTAITVVGGVPAGVLNAGTETGAQLGGDHSGEDTLDRVVNVGTAVANDVAAVLAPAGAASAVRLSAARQGAKAIDRVEEASKAAENASAGAKNAAGNAEKGGGKAGGGTAGPDPEASAPPSVPASAPVPAAAELHRPYIRKGVREEVEKRAMKDDQGRFIDPNTLQPIEGKYDLGHRPGNEFWREKAQAESEGLTQKQFNDRMNDPDKYQIEDPSSNRSHKYEKKDDE